MDVPDEYVVNILYNGAQEDEEEYLFRTDGVADGMAAMADNYPFTSLALGLPWTSYMHCDVADDSLSIVRGAEVARLSNGQTCVVDRSIHLTYTGDNNGGAWVPTRLVVKVDHSPVPGTPHESVEVDMSMTHDMVVGFAVFAALSVPTGVTQTPETVEWIQGEVPEWAEHLALLDDEGDEPAIQV